MNWNNWIRQIHRWLSIAFTAGFVVNAAVIVLMGDRHPPARLYTLVLVPLFLLLPTGLYLFVLPYLGRSRGRPRAVGFGVRIIDDPT